MKDQNGYFEFIERAYQDGFFIDLLFDDDPSQTTRITFRNEMISYLKVRTGKIGACDPFESMDFVAFDNVFPNGDHPVQLAMSTLEDDERIAFARVLFSSSPTVRWEIAKKSSNGIGQDSYVVESGYGSFFDLDAGLKFVQLANLNEDWLDEVDELMNENYAHTRTWHTVALDGANVVMFTAGEGEGIFHSYVGFDESGKITQLVTDFKIFSATDDDEAVAS